MRHLVLAALLAGVAPAGTAQPDPQGPTEPKAKAKTKTDADLVQGVWHIIGLEANGKAEPDKNYKGNTLTFAKDKATLREGNYPAIDFTFKLEPTTSPKAIELTKGSATLRGIYKLDGDELTLCLGVGSNRPTEFATKAGGDTELFTLKRNVWERYSDKGVGFSVDLPGRPEERKRDAGTPAGKGVVTVYAARNENERVSFLVVVAPLPAKADAKETEAVLAAVRDAAVAEADRSAKATVESEKDFKSNAGGGYAGKELSLVLDGTDPEGKGKGVVRVRVFASGGRAYALAAAGTEEAVKAASANVTRFWNSFRTPADKKGGKG